MSKFFQAQHLNRQPPLGLLEISDYKRLVKEDILDQVKADSLERLDQEIATLSKMHNKNFALLQKLEKLVVSRNNLRKPIQRKIEARQGYLGKDIVNLRNKIVEGYQTKINHLDKVLTEVRKYPEVEKELQKLGLIERQEFSQELREKVLQESKQFIKSLDERHELALDRITGLLGEDLVGNLLYASGEDSHLQQSAIDKARNFLVKAITEKKLQSPRQVVPWLIKKETYTDKYWQVFNFLAEKGTGDVLKYIDTEEAKKLLTERQEVIKENRMFQQLFGKSYVSSFWKAFQARQENFQRREKPTREQIKPRANFQPNKFTKSKSQPKSKSDSKLQTKSNSTV